MCSTRHEALRPVPNLCHASESWHPRFGPKERDPAFAEVTDQRRRLFPKKFRSTVAKAR
jgi:hypothetical protein